ncbi:hypothetical protein LWC34_08150 [Kibdelosporangium philippinense]|uniref:Uncharacterized protein n=1 Tax=Kibdelosporangium philippinense TaxID=211113 RepID=A0ABS8Z813_9PSEU|nr:hypothetical protein [Kibdelosporangium philippinense]MCE7002801.1 hypothetical protein [Kibdelosporangium philippinense]
MRTRRLAILLLLPFLWLVIASCAPHTEDHPESTGVVSTLDGHCHHETEPHSHDYFAAVPTTVAPIPVTAPVSVEPEHLATAVAPVRVAQPRSRTGRTVLIDLSIART